MERYISNLCYFTNTARKGTLLFIKSIFESPSTVGEFKYNKWFEYKLTWRWRMTCEIWCGRRKPNRPRLQKPLGKKGSIIKLPGSIKWKIKVRAHRRRRVYSINLARLRPVACFCRRYSVKNFWYFSDDNGRINIDYTDIDYKIYKRSELL